MVHLVISVSAGIFLKFCGFASSFSEADKLIMDLKKDGADSGFVYHDLILIDQEATILLSALRRWKRMHPKPKVSLDPPQEDLLS